MSRRPSDLDRVLDRLGSDPAFFAECRTAVRAKQGDEAILAMVSVVARHGYLVTFEQARQARRRAVTLAQEEEDAVRRYRQTLSKTLQTSPDSKTLDGFLKQW